MRRSAWCSTFCRQTVGAITILVSVAACSGGQTTGHGRTAENTPTSTNASPRTTPSAYAAALDGLRSSSYAHVDGAYKFNGNLFKVSVDMGRASARGAFDTGRDVISLRWLPGAIYMQAPYDFWAHLNPDSANLQRLKPRIAKLWVQTAPANLQLDVFSLSNYKSLPTFLSTVFPTSIESTQPCRTSPRGSVGCYDIPGTNDGHLIVGAKGSAYPFEVTADDSSGPPDTTIKFSRLNIPLTVTAPARIETIAQSALDS